MSVAHFLHVLDLNPSTRTMNTSILDLENSLKAQLSSLADDIRIAETSLIATKEGYLKVQGALEILDILKKKIQDDKTAGFSEQEDD